MIPMKGMVVKKQNPAKFSGGIEVRPVDSGSAIERDEGLKRRV